MAREMQSVPNRERHRNSPNRRALWLTLPLLSLTVLVAAGGYAFYSLVWSEPDGPFSRRRCRSSAKNPAPTGQSRKFSRRRRLPHCRRHQTDGIIEPAPITFANMSNSTMAAIASSCCRLRSVRTAAVIEGFGSIDGAV